MVHRAADSRLLNNLLQHEKAYVHGIEKLLETNHSSLSSLSAYASCSSPPTSNIILAVSSGSLQGADEALQRYAAAVDVYRHHLKSLKALEDDVGSIMRDREILVTRLIKASKVDAPHKLNDAQAELQACELHLADKEKELDEKRVAAIRDGMTARCTAMVECGWAWGERGKEGLRALEGLAGHVRNTSSGSDVNSQRPSLSHSQFHKPLPDPSHPPSDLSSIAPSQSASQINLVHGEHSRANSYDQHEPAPRLSIPAAHSLNDSAFFLPSAARHTLSRRITEEELGQGDASSSDDERDVQVVENKRFSTSVVAPSANPRSGSPLLGRSFALRNSDSVRKGTMSDIGPASHRASAENGSPYRSNGVSGNSQTMRERKNSSSGGFLSGLRGLFGGHKKDRESDAESEHETSGYYGGGDRDSTIRPGKNGGRWTTRTDKNLVAARARKGDESSDDEGPSRADLIALPGGGANGVTFPAPIAKRATKKGGAIRKKSTKGVSSAQSNDIGAQRAEAWVGEERQRLDSASRARESQDNLDRGWMSDGGIQVVSEPVARKTSTKIKKAGRSDSVRRSMTEPQSLKPSLPVPVAGPSRLASPPPVAGPSKLTLPSSASVVSVPSSIGSVASAPGLRRAATVDDSGPKRSNSVGKAKSKPHERRASAGVGMGEGSLSLMSIVEGVSKQNREGWKQQTTESWKFPVSDSSASLQPIKAPPRVTREGLDAQVAATQQTPTSPPLPVVPISPSLPALPASAGLGRTYTAADLALPSTAGLAVERQASPASRPAKSPFRSALRSRDANGSTSSISREPSPNGAETSAPSSETSVASAISIVAPVPIVAAMQPISPSSTRETLLAPAGDVTRSNEASPSIYLSVKEKEADMVSISSYETGNEVFVDAEDTETEDAVPPPPPPHDPVYSYTPSQQYAQNYGTSEISSASTETELPERTVAPQRRKSVRMSMQPTFSPTPPAFDDDEDDHTPWGPPSEAPTAWVSKDGRGSSRGQSDMWADSSDEDEDYARAKRMLSKVGRKKGKTT